MREPNAPSTPKAGPENEEKRPEAGQVLSNQRPARTVVLLGTAPAAEAPELARYLVEQRLVACVNLIAGARSIYRWQGEVCDEQETVLIMKTTSALLQSLEAAYVEQHSYATPELIVLPTAGGHRPYLDWVEQAVGEPAAARD